MKGVFGVALLLVGFTIGYLVLAGKLPSSQPIVGTSSSGKSNTPASGATGSASPVGLPTVKNLSDLTASNGGMS